MLSTATTAVCGTKENNVLEMDVEMAFKIIIRMQFLTQSTKNTVLNQWSKIINRVYDFFYRAFRMI